MTPLFLDFEASSFEGYPIEVAWSLPDGRVRNILIEPEVEWDELLWDPVAENIHGLIRSDLFHGSLRAADVCALLNEDLRGCKVYCDGLLFDMMWLGVLYDSVPYYPSFELSDIWKICREVGIEEAFSQERARIIQQEVRTQHIARNDVLNLRDAWRQAYKRRPKGGCFR